MGNYTTVSVAEQPKDRLYAMKLRFKANAGVKELEELTAACGFREVPVAVDAVTLHMEQVVPFIPDDGTLARYADILLESYNKAHPDIRLHSLRFDGYEYLYAAAPEQAETEKMK